MSDEVTTEQRIQALVEHLECQVDEIKLVSDDRHEFDRGNQSYLVLTEDEADVLAREDILDSLWAFKTNFLMDHMDLNLDPATGEEERVEKAFKKLQKELCESANPIFSALIKDKDEFVQNAIDADTRGHFLSHYDGDENEIKLGGTWFYIYRTN